MSPTSFILSTQPLTYYEELRNNLLEAQTYDDGDLRHWDVLNAVYRRLMRQGMLSPHTDKG
jgi:hypothetical protein